jgi:hypothetical protein
MASSTHDTSTATPNSADPAAVTPDSANAQFPARGIFVGFIIFFLIASTVAMVAFIWYRWNGVREPTTAVIVHGDAGLAGTLITVSGPDRVVRATLDSSNNYNVPILVDPGVYTVRAELGGRLLLNKDVEVRRFFGVMFNLSQFVKDLPPGGLPDPLRGDDTGATPASGPSARAAGDDTL